MDLISMKFGGTSMGSAININRCAQIIIDKQKTNNIVVTVSAMSGITDNIIATLNFAKQNKPKLVAKNLAHIQKKHRDAINDIYVDKTIATEEWNKRFKNIFIKFSKILTGISYVGDVTEKIEAYIISHGEKLSSHLLCCALENKGCKSFRVEAEKIISTNSNYLNAEINVTPTIKALKKQLLPLLEERYIAVVTGFIGKDTKGDTTLLGRGGSDYTASVIGTFLNAKRIEIWTDVNGIMSADPRIVHNAISWESLDFQIASEMAYSGAKVIHPKSVTVAIDNNIPVYVFNSFNTSFAGTRIDNKTIEKGIKGIILSSSKYTVINIFNPRMIGEIGFISDITAIFHKYGVAIDVFSTAETSFSLTIATEFLSRKLLEELKRKAEITLKKNVCKLSIVGHMEGNFISNTIIETLHILTDKHVHVYTTSVDSARHNITLIIGANINIKELINSLHKKLIHNNQEQ